MASLLVPLTEAQAYLDVDDAGDLEVLDLLIDQVEALFLAQTNRRERPFQAAQSGRTEVHDGTGMELLFLEYPIAALTSVKIGANVATPDETLTVGDLDVLRYAVGRRRLARVDGGTFGDAGDPRVVHVTYDAQADLPTDAQLAVLRVVAAVFRQRGSEDASSERTAGFSTDLAKVAESDPLWQLAVNAHREFHVG